MRSASSLNRNSNLCAASLSVILLLLLMSNLMIVMRTMNLSKYLSRGPQLNVNPSSPFHNSPFPNSSLLSNDSPSRSLLPNSSPLSNSNPPSSSPSSSKPPNSSLFNSSSSSSSLFNSSSSSSNGPSSIGCLRWTIPLEFLECQYSKCSKIKFGSPNRSSLGPRMNKLC